MRLDPAVARMVGIDPANAVIKPTHGGCSSASTAKVTCQDPSGEEKTYFMKFSSGTDAESMFRGEAASLSAIQNVVPSICPKVYGWGKFDIAPSIFFIITEFLTLGPATMATTASSPPSLASKLATLHTTPAPNPDGQASPMFGFPVSTFCGDTPQDNTFSHSWADFFATRRLRHIAQMCKKANGRDSELEHLIEQVADSVVPWLLDDCRLGGDKGIFPVVVHGDLWSGNAGSGCIEGRCPSHQQFVFDPSAVYAHSEYELGIMKMFGGFGQSFFHEYHKLCPKTEPVEEYEDRVQLYELYHHLNHLALFGGSYRAGAIGIMKRLIARYQPGRV